MVIYKITNKFNGKSYIGQTVQSLERRWRSHCWPSRTNGCHALRSAINKYGSENFIVEEITKCKSVEEMNYREIFYIKLFDTMTPNGYNLRTGGDNSRFSEESKLKLAKSCMGRNIPIQTRIAASNANKGENNSQVKLTEHQVNLIKNMYITGLFTQKYLANKFNIAQTQVSRITRGESWKYLERSSCKI